VGIWSLRTQKDPDILGLSGAFLAEPVGFDAQPVPPAHCAVFRRATAWARRNGPDCAGRGPMREKQHRFRQREEADRVKREKPPSMGRRLHTGGTGGI
jgi:hypothetical protein